MPGLNLCLSDYDLNSATQETFQSPGLLESHPRKISLAATPDA